MSQFFAHISVLWGNHMETRRKLSIDMFLTMSRLCSVHSKRCNLSGETAFSPSYGRCAGHTPLLPSIGRFVSFPERPKLEPVTLLRTNSLPLYDIKRNVYELLINMGCIVAQVCIFFHSFTTYEYLPRSVSVPTYHTTLCSL